MDFQVATLCDSATDYNGKMCLLGTFDTICATQFPVIHAQCALALRICFRPEDEGTREFLIRVIDADGKTVVAIPPQQANAEAASLRVDVKMPADAYFLSRNLVFNLFRLKFDNPGQYSIDISVDGRVQTQIPLRIMQLQQREQPARN